MRKWMKYPYLTLEPNKWTDIKFEKGQFVPETRYGHTAVNYNSKIYIYGGYRRYVESFKIRESYGDIAVFDTDSLKWSKPSWKGISSYRRHHTASIIGFHMVIHGGRDEKSRLLDSLCAYDLKSNKWLDLPYKGDGHGKISHHTCCTVVYPERKKQDFDMFELHSTTDKYTSKVMIKYEGLYFFGGINEIGYSTNKLSVVTFSKKYLHWDVIETSGKQPLSRYGHSMHMIPWMNCLLLFGGRHEGDMLKPDPRPTLLNDLWILKLQNLEWGKVVAKGDPPEAVYAHWSEIYGSQIFIFGGLKGSNRKEPTDMKLQYNTSAFSICELHQKRANLLNKQHEVKLLIAKK